jgi:phosphoheptose isomerase
MLESHPALEKCETEVVAAFGLLRDCYNGGGKVLVCGNGGSAADAEHIVGELMNKLRAPRPIDGKEQSEIRRGAVGSRAEEVEYVCENLQRALPAISLSSQTALMTAVGNDVAADMVFAQQVFGYGVAGDVLWAISTSGNSRNILTAALVAKARGVKVLGLTGADGGALAERSDVVVRVPERVTYRVQELHLPVYHTACSMLECELFGEADNAQN